jgi:hypothetical protein
MEKKGRRHVTFTPTLILKRWSFCLVERMGGYAGLYCVKTRRTGDGGVRRWMRLRAPPGPWNQYALFYLLKLYMLTEIQVVNDDGKLYLTGFFNKRFFLLNLQTRVEVKYTPQYSSKHV